MISFLRIIICAFSFFILTASSNHSFAADKSKWANLPIAHEGRVKPIDSFSRIILRKIAGSESIDGIRAATWLKEALFTPAIAMERQLFKTYNPIVLNLEPRESKQYTYLEIAQGIQKKQKIIQQLLNKEPTDWTGPQNELMRLYQNYILMTQLLRSMTAFLPLPFDVPEGDASNLDGINNYIDFLKIEQELTKKIEGISKKNNQDISKFSEEEQALTEFVFNTNIIRDGGTNNTLFKVLPKDWNDENKDWGTVWDTVHKGTGSPKTSDYSKIWQSMVQAYLDGKTETFNNLTNEAYVFFEEKHQRLSIEIFFNVFPSKNLATIAFLATFILAAAVIFRKEETNNTKTKRIISILPQPLFIFSTLLLALHIGLRIFILDRPPVGTLYESMLFVALICVLISLFLSLKQKSEDRSQSFFVGSLCAFLLLYLSNGIVDIDRLPTLSAVLNTNFWLTTHVLTITIGYGFCLIAGILAHIHLFQIGFKSKQKESFKTLMVVSIFALLFTTVGTILGGVWADQSWGRFWGWDPKENGALLIVLWIVWLVHSRISGHIQKFGFTVGMCFINIVVILAWFGVNLLNIGLHSYGFIEGIALAITIFCLAELRLQSEQTQ
ncbi:MAG: cytochrome c biogenesis protein CcsA, partial [Pseudomonadota bacterium]